MATRHSAIQSSKLSCFLLALFLLGLSRRRFPHNFFLLPLLWLTILRFSLASPLFLPPFLLRFPEPVFSFCFISPVDRFYLSMIQDKYPARWLNRRVHIIAKDNDRSSILGAHMVEIEDQYPHAVPYTHTHSLTHTRTCTHTWSYDKLKIIKAIYDELIATLSSLKLFPQKNHKQDKVSILSASSQHTTWSTIQSNKTREGNRRETNKEVC